MIIKNVLCKMNHTFFAVNFYFLGSSGISRYICKNKHSILFFKLECFCPVWFLSWGFWNLSSRPTKLQTSFQVCPHYNFHYQERIHRYQLQTGADDSIFWCWHWCEVIITEQEKVGVFLLGTLPCCPLCCSLVLTLIFTWVCNDDPEISFSLQFNRDSYKN